MRLTSFLFLLFLSISSGLSAQLASNDQEAKALMEAYFIQKQERNYPAAERLLQEGIALLNQRSPDTLWGQFYAHFTQLNYSMGRMDAALESEAKAVSYYEKGYGIHKATAFSLFNLAYLQNWVKADPDQAIGTYQRSLDMYNKLQMPLDVAETYRSIGLIQAKQRRLYDAAKAYQTASGILERLEEEYPDLFKKHTKRSIQILSWCYLNIAELRSLLDDQQQVRNYLRRSQDLLMKYASDYPALALEAKENQARLYQKLGEPNKTIVLYQNLLNEADHDLDRRHVSRYLIMLIEAYNDSNIRKYEEVIKTSQQLLQHEKQYPNLSPPQLTSIYKNRAQAYLALKDWSKTKNSISQAWGNEKKAERKEEKANLYAMEAQLALATQSEQEALDKIELSIAILDQHPSPSLAEKLAFRSKICLNLYHRTSQLPYLDLSESSAREALQMVKAYEDQTFQQRSYGTKYRLPSTYLIEVLFLRYQQKPTDATLAEIFELMGQSRGRRLRLGQSWKDELLSNRYPTDWIAQYHHLERQRLRWSQKRYQLEKEGGVEEEKFTVGDSLVQAENKLAAWREKMHAYHPLPAYQASLNAIQNSLRDGSAMLMYYLADSSMISMTILPHSVHLHRISIDEIHREIFVQLPLLVADPQSDVGSLQELLHSAYEYFVAPQLKTLPAAVDQLILIPDGDLHNLPWSALCTSAVESDDYREWSYLIKQYSLSLLPYPGDLLSWDATRSVNSIACFAPKYAPAPASPNRPELASLIRDGFWELPGAQEEVKDIASIYGSYAKIYPDTCRQSFFMEQVLQSDMLHLAMHALSDQQDPSQSYLLFPFDPISEGRLTALELLSAGLETDLMVLSACYSGHGPWLAGDGVQSLAYTMRNVGVKTVLSNNWAVSDRFSAKLMPAFHQYLKNGLSVDQALRQAQLDYLRQAAPIQSAHPFYWAGWQLQGQPSPLFKKRMNWQLYIPIALILLGLGYWGMSARKSRAAA